MKLIPFEKFIIKSDKDILELVSSLSENIEQKKHLRIKRNNKKPYEGIVSVNSFKVNRIIYYQNPFLPSIIGELVKFKNGETVIKIMIRVKYSTLVFILFWSFAPTLFFITNPPQEIGASLVVSVIWIVIGYLFITIAFNLGRKKDKDFFINLLK